jgi:hypothetical protein
METKTKPCGTPPVTGLSVLFPSGALIVNIYLSSFLSIAPKIAGKERKIIGPKKNIHLLSRSIFELTHFAITSLIHILMKMQLFPRIFGHRVTYQAKEQQMPMRHFTQRLGNIFIHPIQIFWFFMKF